MRLTTYSTRNLKRRKARTILAALGIALGVMLITSLLIVTDGLETSIAESLSIMSGNLIVQEKGAVDQAFSIVNASLVQHLEENADIEVISPEIYVTRTLGSGPRFVNVIGITSAYRELVSPNYIIEGSYFNDSERGKTILGRRLAEKLELTELGSVFELDSYGFTVVGIFETGTLVDSIVALVPLEDARDIRKLPSSQLSIIEVKPKEAEKAGAIRDFVESTVEGYEVVFPEDLISEASEAIRILRSTIWVLSAIAVVIGGMGIANAMLMSVIERTPEIGLLKATGWRNVDVGYAVLIEALGIGILGCMFGLILGMLAGHLASYVIPELTIRLSTLTTLESFLFGVILSLLGGIYPAVKASRLSPIEAMRGK